MAAPTVDNTGQIGTTQSFPQSITSFVVGSGANKFLFLGVSFFASTSISVSSAVFNTTENLTHLDTNQVTVSGGFETTEIWYLKNPTTTTANVTVTYSATPGEAVIGATSWFGVDQATPLGTAAKGQGVNTATSPTVDVTSTTVNQIIHDTVSADEFPGVLTATGTQRWNGHSGVNGTAGAGQTKAGSGGTVTMNWTQAGSGKNWSIMGVAINGVADAAIQMVGALEMHVL